MGLVPLTLEMLQRYIGHVGGFNGCRMMELGDQQMYCHANVPEASAAKSYFEALGVQHTSIDLNGALGAIPLDLSKPIDRPAWIQAFDVVTDFGTTEHVGRDLAALHACRQSCHAWCRPGGLLIFVNPKTGHWPGHGFHYFTTKHYEALAAACHYRVLEISENPTLGNTTDGWQVHAAFIKQEDVPFPALDEFKTICAGTVYPA
jgi:hypothetical protein